ncbi:DUF2599 domain-containing protein [Cellulomonas soli]
MRRRRTTPGTAAGATLARGPLTADSRALRAGLVAGLLGLALAGCTSTPTPPAPTTTEPAASTPAAPAAVALTSGALTLTLQPEGGTAVSTAAGEDGSATAQLLRVTPAGTSTGTTTGTHDDTALVHIQPPAGVTATVLSDRSATFADASGALVGALGTPTGPYGAALGAAADGSLTLTTPADDTEAVGLWLASSALLDAQWGDQEGGRSLSVTPAAWTRVGSLAAQELTWAQLVVREPEADSPTMHDQLVCHMLGAPTKDTWNLEPWRPQVDLVTLVATKCNPTEAAAG